MSEKYVQVRVRYIDGAGESDLRAELLKRQAEYQRLASTEPVARPTEAEHPGSAGAIDPENVREISEQTRAALYASPAFRNSRGGRRLIKTRPELFPDLDE